MIKLRLKLLILDSPSLLKRVSNFFYIQIRFSFYFLLFLFPFFNDFFFFFKVDKGFSNLCGLILTQLYFSKFFFLVE